MASSISSKTLEGSEVLQELLADVLLLNGKVTLERRSLMPEVREKSKENSLDDSSGMTQVCATDQENHHLRADLEVRGKTE